MNWELLIATFALLASFFSIVLTIYKTRHTQKDKIETFRHQLIIRSYNILFELESYKKAVQPIIDKYSNASELREELNKSLKHSQELFTKSNELIKNQKKTIAEISDKETYNDMKSLRGAELDLNQFEKFMGTMPNVIDTIFDLEQLFYDDPFD